MEAPNADVVEIVKINSAKKATAYLSAGYRLIGVYQMAELTERKNQIFLRKGPEFVLCRPIGVDPFTPSEYSQGSDAPSEDVP